MVRALAVGRRAALVGRVGAQLALHVLDERLLIGEALDAAAAAGIEQPHVVGLQQEHLVAIHDGTAQLELGAGQDVLGAVECRNVSILAGLDGVRAVGEMQRDEAVVRGGRVALELRGRLGRSVLGVDESVLVEAALELLQLRVERLMGVGAQDHLEEVDALDHAARRVKQLGGQARRADLEQVEQEQLLEHHVLVVLGRLVLHIIQKRENRNHLEFCLSIHI